MMSQDASILDYSSGVHIIATMMKEKVLKMAG
jgi:hypothetical protein